MAGIYTTSTTAEDVRHRLAGGEKVAMIDVREDHEWAAGHIPGARHIPLGTLGERHHELNSDKETIIVCHSGGRSSVACEYLESLGYKVVNMVGGMLAWEGELAFGK